jgi:hydrogenase expression/formation protein HypC
MCLAVPGKILEIFEEDGVRMATVDFGGIRRKACLAYQPDARVGTFVVVHVGFAVSTVDEEAAARSYALLGEVESLEAISS